MRKKTSKQAGQEFMHFAREIKNEENGGPDEDTSSMIISDDCPEEIKKAFLESVTAFEKAAKSAKRCKIFDILGQPSFSREEAIPEDQIEKKLIDLRVMMCMKGIEIDSIYEVADREMYRFITEEVFEIEIDHLDLPGYVTHFIYEEFYPNHREDIKAVITEFIYSYLNKEDEKYRLLYGKEDPVHSRMENFRNIFDRFSLLKFKIEEINFTEEESTVVFHIDFAATVSRPYQKKRFKGRGMGMLENNYNVWAVHEVVFPEAG
jgi:hypothetical protein